MPNANNIPSDDMIAIIEQSTDLLRVVDQLTNAESIIISFAISDEEHGLVPGVVAIQAGKIVEIGHEAFLCFVGSAEL
jgi:hypothetical protein